MAWRRGWSKAGRAQGPQGPQAQGPRQSKGQGTDFLPDTDFPGNALRGVHHVPTKEACCALCANDTRCSAGSWDGPKSKYAKSATCPLKTAAPQSGKVTAAGMEAFVLRPPSGPPQPRG